VEHTIQSGVRKLLGSENIIWFRALCQKNGIPVTEEQLYQLNRYVELLLNWNKKINLISRKDEDNVWAYHILHSISLLLKIKLSEGSRIVDIGSGGGLPGVPLKILRPDISLLCLDATRKKVHAVMQIVEEIKLDNVNVIWGRAEEVGMQPKYYQTFDFAIARAVCQLDELIALSINFLAKKNFSRLSEFPQYDERIDPHAPALIAFKGGELKQELDTARRTYPDVNIKTIDLIFNGSEKLIASDKKILLVHM
jgi:16S rRNA (guanine527-N7)-methyltransferase